MLFDVGSSTFRAISGPASTFDAFAITSDSRHAYVLPASGPGVGSHLYDLDIEAATATQIDPGFPLSSAESAGTPRRARQVSDRARRRA